MTQTSNAESQVTQSIIELRTYWKRILGWILLGSTVVMWTSSNFIFSFMFADETYNKPMFVTWLNTSSFLCLIPFLLLSSEGDVKAQWLAQLRTWDWRQDLYRHVTGTSGRVDRSNTSGNQRRALNTAGLSAGMTEEQPLLEADDTNDLTELPDAKREEMTLPETIVFAVKFSILWVLANYSTAACFQSLSVASGTVLVSTSSLWTLLLARLLRVEIINWQKSVGVILSLIGVVCILGSDLFGNSNDDDHRGSFPSKSRRDVAIGSVLALASAVMYGLYGTFAKKSIPDERLANMPLIFCVVGLFNLVALLPVLALWHILGIETFELPRTKVVVFELLLNAIISVASDLTWFYAVMLTSPVVVTVVLTLTIPLSMLGQVAAHGQYAPGITIVGSTLVTIACVLVNLDLHDLQDPGRTEQQDENSR